MSPSHSPCCVLDFTCCAYFSQFFDRLKKVRVSDPNFFSYYSLFDFNNAVVLDGDGHAGFYIVEELIAEVIDDGHFCIRPYIA